MSPFLHNDARECATLLRTNHAAFECMTAELLEHDVVSGEVVDACVAADGTQQVLPLAA